MSDTEFVPLSSSESESMEEAVTDYDSPITQDPSDDEADQELLEAVYDASFDKLVDAFRQACRMLGVTLSYDEYEDLAQRGVEDLRSALSAKAAEMRDHESASEGEMSQSE